MYIGPCVKVICPTTTVVVDKCKDHNVPNDANYCPVCATHKTNRMYQYKALKDAPYNWESIYPKGEFTDYLYSANYSSTVETDTNITYHYIPNRHYDELGVIHSYDSQVIVITDMDFNKSIAKFKEIFKEELEYLQKWFTIEILYICHS